MTIRVGPNEEESCLEPISGQRWCGLTRARRLERLREAIFRCHRGFLKHYRDSEERVDALVKRIKKLEEARERDKACPYESTVLTLDKRVAEFEREAENVTFNRGQSDRPAFTVDGEPFTEENVRRWRRMEKPARALASISWHDRQFWPSADATEDEAVRRWMRDLAEAYYR